MSIKFITGTPGAGKSLCMVDELCKMKEAEPHRECYAVGIDGLRADVAAPLDSPERWQDLPDGSIVAVDEAWRWLPTHGPSQQPPEWVRMLAEHRHRGFDFLLATQHPTQVSPFVRKLSDDHIHLIRKFGTHMVQRVRWTSVHTDTQSVSTIKSGQVAAWRFPKERFALYQSATMHTVKRRIPKRVFVAVGLFLLLPLLLWYGWRSLHRLSTADVPVAADVQTVDVASPGRDVSPRSPEQWANARLPRVQGVPWSAPMWDSLETTTVPDMLCMIGETDDRNGTVCSCYTEQVTPLPNVPDGVCRAAAHHGVYNPYRGRPDRGERTASGSAHAQPSAVGPRSAAVASAGEVVGMDGPPRGWGADAIHAGYRPPEWVPAPGQASAVH